MRITRRHVAACALALAALPAIAHAESADEAAVKKAVDDLNKAMIAADKAKLEMLTAASSADSACAMAGNAASANAPAAT